jgi:predicted transcriptional regulator
VLDKRINSMTEFAEQVGRDYDAFDLVCHVAFDQLEIPDQTG